MMAPLSYEDSVWIIVVVMLTEAVKRLWPIRRRYWPVIPLLVAVPIGLLLAWSEPWAGWAAFVRVAVTKALTIGGLGVWLYDTVKKASNVADPA